MPGGRSTRGKAWWFDSTYSTNLPTIRKGVFMKFVWFGLVWMALTFFMLAAFHAMVTIRNMESIKFDNCDELERGDF